MKALPFDDYPLRIFVADRQLSVQYIEILHQFQNKHRQEVEHLSLTKAQKNFFITLVETLGVIKIAVHINEIYVWKWPGYEWTNIERGISAVLHTYPISSDDIKRQTKLVIQQLKRMALLYTAPYFRRYLKLSIAIFGAQYTAPNQYQQHPLWKDFLEVLRDAGVEKILIAQGRMIGSIAREYICFPITPNSVSEEKIRRDYPIIAEEIFL